MKTEKSSQFLNYSGIVGLLNAANREWRSLFVLFISRKRGRGGRLKGGGSAAVSPEMSRRQSVSFSCTVKHEKWKFSNPTRDAANSLTWKKEKLPIHLYQL